MASRAQGATEYLVLLAVVLIIALVAIALLGFFPGTASDAQLRESELYYESASPVSIIDLPGAYYSNLWGLNTTNLMIIRIRNSGTYPVRITRIIGGGAEVLQYYSGTYNNLSIYLAPGEETCIGNHNMPQCNSWSLQYEPATIAAPYGNVLNGTSTRCDTQGRGVLTIKNFGFAYTQYVEGQQITKKQAGTKDLLVKCIGTWP